LREQQGKRKRDSEKRETESESEGGCVVCKVKNVRRGGERGRITDQKRWCLNFGKNFWGKIHLYMVCMCSLDRERDTQPGKERVRIAQQQKDRAVHTFSKQTRTNTRQGQSSPSLCISVGATNCLSIIIQSLFSCKRT